MQLINGELYLTIPETAGWTAVSEGYLQTAVSRNLKCWQSTRAENGQLLIRWETMRRKAQKLIVKQIGDPYEYQQRQQKMQRLESRSAEQEALPMLVDARTKAEDFQYFRKHLDKEQAADCATACAWLRLLGDVKGKVDARAYGFSSKADMYEAVLAHLALHPLQPLKVSNRLVLQRRVRAFRESGRESVLPKKLGNSNASKITDDGKKWLIAAMADPHKPPIEVVTMCYNREADKRGWKMITPQTAGNFLNRPKVKIKWVLGRHGEDAWYQQYDMTITRKNASAPDVLWVVDGTPLDLYYQEEVDYLDKKTRTIKTRCKYHSRAYLFAVIDAYSWKLIGWSLSQSEDVKAVRDALKKAVQCKMTLPRQLQSDQGAAILAQSFLIQQLKVHNTPTRPYSPKAKVIEAVFGHFQNQVLRYFDNWAGCNITAKKQDSRMNPDFVHANKKEHPTWDGLVEQFTEAVKTWNETATEKRKAPDVLYGQKGKGREVGTLAFLDMFWEKRNHPVKYRQDGLRLQVDKQEFLYWSNDLDFYTQHVRDSFHVAFDRECADYIYLYKGDKPFIWKGEHMILRLKDEIPMALADQKEGDRKRLNKMMELKDRAKEKVKRELEEIQAETQVKMGARYVFKDSLNDSETRVKQRWNRVLENGYSD